MKNSTQLLLEAHSKIGVASLWNEALDLLTSVDIQPAKSVKQVNLSRIKPKVNQCYLNALAVCMRNPNVDYVEGYIEVHGVPLDHAWNSYKGIHFDVTQEAIHDRKEFDCPHRAIMVISSKKVMEFAAKSEMSGPFLYQWLVNEKEREKEVSSHSSRS